VEKFDRFDYTIRYIDIKKDISIFSIYRVILYIHLYATACTSDTQTLTVTLTTKHLLQTRTQTRRGVWTV